MIFCIDIHVKNLTSDLAPSYFVCPAKYWHASFISILIYLKASLGFQPWGHLMCTISADTQTVITKAKKTMFPSMTTVCSDLFTVHRSIWRLMLLLVSHLRIIFTCSELWSGVCSLAVGDGESLTVEHIYYSCHLFPLFLSHSLSITLLYFLSQSLCLFLPLWQTCITCMSLIFHFLLPFAFHLLSCLVFFCIHTSPLSSLWHSPLFLSPSVSVLCLAYFHHLLPPPLVFCFVYVVSLGSLFCTVRE